VTPKPSISPYKKARSRRPCGLAELEIGTHDHAADAQAFHQNFHDEVLGRARRHLGIERERIHDVCALLRDQTRLGAERREAKRFRRRVKKFLRMRLEGEHAETRAPLLRNSARLPISA